MHGMFVLLRLTVQSADFISNHAHNGGSQAALRVALSRSANASASAVAAKAYQYTPMLSLYCTAAVRPPTVHKGCGSTPLRKALSPPSPSAADGTLTGQLCVMQVLVMLGASAAAHERLVSYHLQFTPFVGTGIECHADSALQRRTPDTPDTSLLFFLSVCDILHSMLYVLQC